MLARKIPPCMFCGGRAIIMSLVGPKAGMSICDDPECRSAANRKANHNA